MPLSRDEQRALDEIERGLLNGDPEFAQRLRRRSPLLTTIVVAGVAISMVAGLALITTGLFTSGPAQSVAAVAGFALVVGSCWAALTRLRQRLFRRRKAR